MQATDRTYKLAYGVPPGIAFVYSGTLENQRWGFHSNASSPQMSLLQLYPYKLTETINPFETGTVWIVLPCRSRMGLERGRTVSRCALSAEGD